MPGPAVGKLAEKISWDKLGLPAKVLFRPTAKTEAMPFESFMDLLNKAPTTRDAAAAGVEALVSKSRDELLGLLADRQERRVPVPVQLRRVVDAAVLERAFVRKVAIRSEWKTINYRGYPYLDAGAFGLGSPGGAKKHASHGRLVGT